MNKLLQIFLFICCIHFAQAQVSDEVQQLVEQGVALHDSEKYDEAIEVYRKALEIDEESGLVLYQLGYAYYAQGNYRKAKTFARKCLKTKQSKFMADAYVMLGNIYDIEGRHLKAVRTFKKGLSSYPDNYLLHYNLGLAYYHLRDLERTEKALIRAIKTNPYHSSSHYLLAFAKLDAEQNIQAMLGLSFFLLLEPESERADYALEYLFKILQLDEYAPRVKKIYLGAGGDDPEGFKSAELMLSMMHVNDEIAEGEQPEREQKFYNSMLKIGNHLKELEEDNQGFWWDFYVQLYGDLIDEKYFETFCYFITQKEDGAGYLWLQANDDRVSDMLNYLNEWRFVYR
ncbi:MAG: tetratricopeptide repeat protein [Saprospiraceae bacterium]|nr:tetratricopeptide repeat protein [Saprospiraceae bacterium]